MLDAETAIAKGDATRRDAILNELRVLNACRPESLAVRRQFGEALYRTLMDDISIGAVPKEGDEPHPLLRELWELVANHPEDSELLEFFRSRFHMHAGNEEGGRRIDPTELL